MPKLTTPRLLERLRRYAKPAKRRRARHRAAFLESLEGRRLLSATSFETEKVLVAAGATGDTFGFAVSIDGDTAVVGSRLADPGGVADGGAAAIYTRDVSGDWTFQDDLVGGDVVAGDHFGYSVSIDGNTAVVGAMYEDSVGKSGNGAAYVFVDDGAGNWSLEQKLTAADAQDADRFGVSVDVDGDTIIAGAHLENSGVSDNGAAYVFTRSGSTWSQQQKLLAGDLESNDQFGFSVSVHGDTALVGSYGDNVGSNADQGSAYIFTRSGNTWSQHTKLLSSDAAAFDQFGRSVSLDQGIAVIGAHLSDTGGVNGAGGAYVFTRNLSGNWSEQTKLQASDGVESDNFGFAVDVRGDKIIVGAHRHDFAGEDASGSAYLFERNGGGSWTEVAKFAASDHEPSASLGFSVAVDGAVALAGATSADDGATTDTGAVYSFTLDEDLGDAPAPYPTLRANNGPSHRIVAGFSLGTAIDMDAEGKASLEANGDDADGSDDEEGVTFGQLKIGDAAATVDVVVTNTAGVANPYLDAWIDFNADGDWDDAGEQIYSGAIAAGTNTLTFSVPADADLGQTYSRFRLHDGTTELLATGEATSGEVEDYRVSISFDVENPKLIQTLLGDPPTASDYVGWSVDIHEDTAVVGVPRADSPTNVNAGGAYVYVRNSMGVWSLQQALFATEDASEDSFGRAVSVSGDTIVVGARLEDSGGLTNNGAAYVFERDTSGTWSQSAKLSASDPGDNDLFGYSVVIDGETVMIGAYHEDAMGDANRGSAYVFNRQPDGSWLQQAKLVSDSTDLVEEFGHTIALDKDTAFIGAPRTDIGSNADAGAIFVFNRDPLGNWSQSEQLVASTPNASDLFGIKARIDGDTAIVGARYADTASLANSGAAYVFSRGLDDLWSEQTILQASTPRAGDEFGAGLNIEGDVIVVGARAADASVNDQGTAYIYTRDTNGDWNFVSEITGIHATTGGYFGIDIGISNGIVLVGALFEDVGGVVNAGAAYLFDLANIDNDFADAPAPYPTLLADNGPVHSRVSGFSLGTAWDSETDGQPSLEANRDDKNGLDDEDGVTFGQLKIGDSAATVDVVVTNTAGVANPYLDAWIDFNADGDWDDVGEQIHSGAVAAGQNTLTFAVPRDAKIGQTFARFRLHDGTTGLLPIGATTSGEVEDYRVSIGFDLEDPDQLDKLFASDARSQSLFGQSVSVDGDTAIVGSYVSGSAYIFAKDGSGGWIEQGRLTASDLPDTYGFGWSVSVEGDTAVVGANFFDAGSLNEAGAAYVFTRDVSGNWTQQAKLTASDAAADDQFGYSVSIDGDTLIVGAHAEETLGYTYTNNGAAYVFTRDSSRQWSEQQKLLATQSDVELFGSSVSLDGDTVLIGALFGDDGNGSAYIFTRDTSNVWSQQTEFLGNGLFSKFGQSVALDGDVAIIGAGEESPAGFALGGAAYIYTRDAAGTWSRDTRLTPSDQGASYGFGWSVSIEGNIAVVSAPFRDTDSDGLALGGVYIFTRNGAGAWIEQQTLLPNDRTYGGEFGSAVALSGETVFATNSTDDDHGQNAGAAYVIGLLTTSEDLGDAPAPYSTLLADDGPVHTELAGFSLGSLWDDDDEGMQSLRADGDDIDGLDDEDGVTFGRLEIGDSAATVDVVVTNTAGVANPYLDAWIDFNADGDWDDAGEQIYSSAIASGTSTLTFAVPGDAEVGQTYARLRLHDGTAALMPTGSATSGEVEDYLVTVEEVLPVATNDSFAITEDDVLSPVAGLLSNDNDPQSRELRLTAINGQSLSVSAGDEIATATPDPNLPEYTTSLNAENYYGFRFEVTETTTIERIGGVFQFISGTGPFAAIVALDNESDFPDSENLSTADVLATAVIPLAFQDDGEKSAEINVDLQPGWYAAMFGTGDFGATGITNLYLNSAPESGTTFIHSQPTVPRFLTPTPASKIPNARLFVTKAGGTLEPTDFTLPSGASLTVGPTGEFTYDPQTAFNSLAAGITTADTFTYTLANSAGGEAEGTVTVAITGMNDAPTAAAQSVVVSENSVATRNEVLGLLNGAADADTGDILSISQINGVDIVSGQPIVLPSGATITVDSDGSFAYDPTTAFNSLTTGETGTDSLTFTASDSTDSTAEATLSITVNGFNDAPQISALTDPIVIDEGGTAALSGTVSDSEIGVLNLSVSIGDVSLAADGETFTWEYTPSDDAPTEIVVITVTDVGGQTSELSFDLTVNNVEPTLILDASLSADQLEPLTLSLDNVVDPGDDTITSATIDWGDGTSTIVDSFANVTHVYTIEPGTYPLEVSLQDEDGTYINVASTLIVITNVAPVLQAAQLSTTAIDEGQTVTLDVSWIDGDESHTIDVDWGDGNTSSVFVGPQTSATSIDYTYVDDTPFGTSQDDFPIVVTVSDSDGSDSTIPAYSITRSFDGLRQIGSTGSTSVVGIETDRSGNQYVAGSFSGELWLGGELVATTGASNTDWYVTKFDGSGARLWTRTIGRSSFAETLEAMTVTAGGDIVLVGGVTNSTDLDPGDGTILPNGGDNVIVRLNSNGDFLNATSLSGALSFSDVGIDSSGNIAVTGQFVGAVDFDPGSGQTLLEASGNWAGFAAVFDASGDLSWARGFIGTDYVAATSVALHENTVTIGGFFRDSVTIDSSNSGSRIESNGDFDVYVARFDLDGNHQWHAATGGTGPDRAYDVAVSRDGSVFVAADARGLIDIDPTETTVDINLGSSLRPLLWALAADGTLLWHDDVRTAGNSRFTEVGISPHDQRIIAGGTFDSLIFNDDGTNIFQPSLGSFLAVYDATGNQEYQTHLTGPGMEEVTAVAATSDGRVLVGGTFNQSIADGDETQTLDVTGGLDAYLAEYTLTAAAPLHPQVTVRNTAPFITNFSLTGDPADASRVILNAEFDDLGTEAGLGIEFGWGDGTVDGYWLEPGQNSVELAHVYVTGPDSPADGIYDVIFGVIDDDFDFAVVSQSIAVASSPEVTFDTFSLTFSEDADTVHIPVTLSVPSSADITIPVIWGGTAIEGVDPEFADYTLVTTDVFIPSGQTTGTLTLQILDDNIDEVVQESIELTLLETDGVTLGRTPIMSVGIDDNDVSTLDVSADATGSVWEDHGTITATLELSGPRDIDTLITIFASGTAEFNTDYSISSPDLETDIDGNAVIRIPAGLSSSELQISLVNDTANETFLESLYLRFDTSDPDVLVGTDRVNLVVRDNDPLVYVGDQSVNPDYRSVIEGQSVTVAVALSAPTNTDRIIPLTAYGYGARRAQTNDFVVPSSVTIPAGATTVNVTVPIQEDNLDEKFERFYIARANQIGGSARGKGVYVGINDNDTSVVNVRARRNVGEGASFDVTVSLTKPSVSDVLVKIRFSGSALPNIVKATNTGLTGFKVTRRDYGIPISVLQREGREAWITLPAGAQSARFPIGVNMDGIGEGNETIVMSIISASGGAQRGTGDTVNILSNRARGTLAKDVSKEQVSISDGSLVFGNLRPGVSVEASKVPTSLKADGSIKDAPPEGQLPINQQGLLNDATLFFDANFNYRRDFLDLDGDGVFSTGDLIEPAFETALDGSTFYTIPEAFDVNGNGEFDSSEGQLVVVGGTDTSVDQPFEQALSAPLGFGIISPMSTLVAQLMQQRNIDITAAAELTLTALELEGFALAANNYLFNAAEGDFFAGEAYRADVRMAVTTRLISALFEGTAGANVRSISTSVFGNIAEKLNGSVINFESTAFLQSVIRGTAFRLGAEIDQSVAVAAAQIIASLQQRVSNVQNSATRSYVDTLATLHRTAEVDLVPVIRGLRNAADPAQLAAENSGSGLDALVAATQVSNVLPPEMYVSDVAVTEGPSGTVVAEIQVGLFGGTDVPVSVAYGTLEGSATEEGNDYVPKSGVLTWQPGDAEIQTIRVLVNGDSQFEEDEFFDLRFEDADGLVMRHDFGRIFILNDDGFSFTAEETAQPTNVRVVAYDDQIEVYQDDALAFAGGISNSGPITISAFDDVETSFELELLSAGALLTNGIQFLGGGSELDTLVVSSTLTEGSQISQTDTTSGQVAFETGVITFTEIETVLDSLSAKVGVDGTLTEGSQVTLSAMNPAFPVGDGDSLNWTVTADNGFLIEGSGQNFVFDLGDNGDYEVELILERSGRGEVSAETAFQVTNAAPTARDDHFSVSEDAVSVALAVLENDSDPAEAADPLQVVSIDGSGTNGSLLLIDGNVLYSPDGNFESLGVNDFETVSFTYTIDDGDGGTDSAAVTLTISGVNDDPTVSDSVSASATEDDGASSVDLLAGAGDVDQDDVLNVDALTLAAGDDSGVTIGANELTVDPSAYDHLAVGESEIIVYSYNVVDGNGGSVAQTATVTISGVNDAPTVSDSVSASATEDEGAFSVDLLAGAGDVDQGDVLNVDALTLAAGDDSGVTIGSNELTVDPSAYDYLAVGESEVIVYSYSIIDGNGGSVAQRVTLTISGVNDDPTVSDSVSASATEDDGASSVDLLAGAGDVDQDDVLNVDALTLAAGDDSGVTIGSNELTVDPSAYDHLAVGESEIIVYSYNVVDGNGGSVIQTATITIMGVNDGPTIESLVSSHDDVTSSSQDGVVNISGTIRDIDASDALTVTIDWGDGSAPQTLAVDGHTDAFGANHQYAGAGVFEVNVTVSDIHGSSVQQTAEAVVQGAGLVGDTLYFIGSHQRDKLWVDETWVYDGSGGWWNPSNWDRRIVASGKIDGTRFYKVIDPATVAALEFHTLDGNDRVIVSHDIGLPVRVDSGAGDDFVLIGSGDASVDAGAGDDVVWTGPGNDFVDGEGGHDQIETGPGNDTVRDLLGNNRIESGPGNDSVTTGDGDDRVDSGDGDDLVTAGGGDDRVDLGDGDDIAWLGAGNDRADGGEGDDIVFGEAGDDRIDGGRGNDVLVGGDGEDRMDGERGLDLLIGGWGADRLDGGKDDDLLIAGWTTYDANAEALQRILVEWSSEQDYATRVANLRTGSGPGLENNRLKVGETVFDDGAEDRLDGQDGRDWFFGSLEDEIKRKRSNELLDLL